MSRFESNALMALGIDSRRLTSIMEFEKSIDWLSQQRVETLLAGPESGEMSLVPYRYIVESLINAADDIRDTNYHLMPKDQFVQMHDFFIDIISSFHQRMSIDRNTDVMAAEKFRATADLIIKTYNSNFSRLFPSIAFLSASREGIKARYDEAFQKHEKSLGENYVRFDKLYKSLNDEVENIKVIKQQTGDLLKDVKSTNDESQTMEKRIREILQTTKVTESMASFEAQRRNLDKAANAWLCLAAVITGAALLFIGFHYYSYMNDVSRSFSWQEMSINAFIVTFLLGMASWASRNHRRNRHNALVVAHRVITISSFMDIYMALGAKGDDRNAILMHCLDAIFQPIPTGYASEDTGQDSTSGLQAIEIARAFKGV